jgi:DNA-binding NarL/FixJ family response regulator
MSHEPKDERSQPLERVRVLIADDHPLVREGLKSVLRRQDIEVVGEASTGRQAVEAAERLNPDVAILDIRMPDMDGLQALAAIKKSTPTVSVLMLTSYEDKEYLLKAVLGGAAGYLLKGSSSRDLVGFVRRIADGESIIDTGSMARVLDSAAGEAEAPSVAADRLIEPLSGRETAILRGLTRGLKNQELAVLLEVKETTVKTHIRHLFRKLRVSDRTQAVVWAARHGLMEIPSSGK